MEKFRVSVDYGRSVEDGVDSGKYGWAASSITSKHFHTNQTGVVWVEVELVPFFRRMLTGEALNELGLMGCSPSNTHQLLALGEQYPEVQRRFPIAALGSGWEHHRGRIFFPYLDSYGSRRDLRLFCIEKEWSRTCQFAVVRGVGL